MCKLGGSICKGRWPFTYAAGVVIATLVFSFQHYTNTKRAKKVWTYFNFCSFLVLRFLVIVVAVAQHFVVPTVRGAVYHIATFIVGFSFSLLVEHYVCTCQTWYGAKRDRELKLILSNSSEIAGRVRRNLKGEYGTS